MKGLYMSSEITVILEATEPMELMRDKTQKNVWMRNLGIDYTRGHRWEQVEIRGVPLDVYDFIALHWGEEEAKYRVLGETTPSYP